MLVLALPPIVRRNPPFATGPPKTRLPALAFQVWAAPIVMPLLMVSVAELLFVTPPEPIV